jgi:hypothetical protein
MISNSIPWPRKGDQLFKADVDWWHNACLNYLHDDWTLYSEGYKRAGDLLVEHMKESRSYQDFLVYPIVFLYRQYIELRLKELIRDGNQLIDNPKKFPKHHKIDELWKHCRRILEKVWPEGPAEDLDAVEECIHQFSEKDPTSMAFRYPTDKNGNRSLPSLSHINLRNLSEVMARISSLLDGTSMAISVYLENKQETEAE